MWENLNMFDNIAFIWTTQIIINAQAEKSPINLKNSKLHYGSVSKERTAKIHVDVTSQRRKPSCFQIAVQGEDTMPEPWNLELCHCWFSVREGNMILCYCSYLLQTLSGIWYWKPCLMSCRLELSHWSMLVLLLHERIAFLRSHYHMGNLASIFFLNGPESCMLKLRNMPPWKKKKGKMANGDWPFENWNVTTARGKVKSRNLPFCKMIRYQGMKMCRKKEG